MFVSDRNGGQQPGHAYANPALCASWKVDQEGTESLIRRPTPNRRPPTNHQLKLCLCRISVMSYFSGRDLGQRFRCSKRTIYRWMKRATNPFPAPCIKYEGSGNLWDCDDVAAWEQRERLRTQSLVVSGGEKMEARPLGGRLRKSKF